MTTQCLQKITNQAALYACSSWIERIFFHVIKIIADERYRKVQKQQLSRLGGFSLHLLKDIGLDNPEVQKRIYGAYIEPESKFLECLQCRYVVWH